MLRVGGNATFQFSLELNGNGDNLAGQNLMLTSLNVESELSYAYLHAVASHAGVICETVGRHSDDAGIDAVLRVRGKLTEDSRLTDFPVEVQLKATTATPARADGRLSYSLRVKNYNELRSTAIVAPRLLVVLFLPEEPIEWLVHTEESLIARKCAYWLSLRNAPASRNVSSQTVYIPESNQLSSENLLTLMTHFSKGEVINYEP